MKALRCAAIAAFLTVYSGCQSTPLETARDRTAPLNSSRPSDLSEREHPAAKGGETALASGWASRRQSANATADPRSVADLLEEGHREVRDGRLEEAKRYYRSVLDQDPKHAAAHHRLAVIADKQRDFPTAEQHYGLALESNPDNENILNDLGYSYLLQGRYQQSEQVLQEALRVNPTFARATKNLGLLYGTMGDYDRALETFLRVGSEREAQAYLAELFPNGPRPSSGVPGRGTPVNEGYYGPTLASAPGQHTAAAPADAQRPVVPASAANPANYASTAYRGEPYGQQANDLAGSSGWPAANAVQPPYPGDPNRAPSPQPWPAVPQYAAAPTASTAAGNMLAGATPAQPWPNSGDSRSPLGTTQGSASLTQSQLNNSYPKAWIADIQPQPSGEPIGPSYNSAMPQAGGAPYTDYQRMAPAAGTSSVPSGALPDDGRAGWPVPGRSAQVFPQQDTGPAHGNHHAGPAQGWPVANPAEGSHGQVDPAAFTQAATTALPTWPQTPSADDQWRIEEARRMAALVGLEVGAGSPFPMAGESGSQAGGPYAPMQTPTADPTRPTTAGYWGPQPGITIQAASKRPAMSPPPVPGGGLRQGDAPPNAPNSGPMIWPGHNANAAGETWPAARPAEGTHQVPSQPSPWPQPRWSPPATTIGDQGIRQGQGSTWPASSPQGAVQQQPPAQYAPHPAGAWPVQQPTGMPANRDQWQGDAYQRWPTGG